mgnify:CR=1 FL=1
MSDRKEFIEQVILKRPFFSVPTKKLNELSVKAFFYAETGKLPIVNEFFPPKMVEMINSDEDKLKMFFLEFVDGIEEEKKCRN